MDMQTPIGPIKIRNSYDEAVVVEVINQLGYERWGDIKIEGTVLDLGAHIGSFSALALSRGCKVIAVEPEPSSFALLKINAPGAIHINKAISNKKHVNLYVDPVRSELNKIADHGIRVEGISLDDLITEPIDVLKIDIEGGEYEALTTCTKLNMVRQITMEYHYASETLGTLLNVLKSNNFELTWIGGSDFGKLQMKRRDK